MPTFDYRVDGSLDSNIVNGMEICRKQSSEVLPLFQKLRDRDFFSYFPIDLMASCPYMPTEEKPCEVDQCEVEPSENVPEEMVNRDEDEYEFALDGWTRKDMPSDCTEYFDLREQLERNTGYNGQRIWRFIHQKICFQENLGDDRYAWKRDFNRVISGMHAAVNAQIVADMGYNEEGLVEYRRRLRDEPGAISNIYFAYMVTLSAIYDVRERLINCDYLGDGADIQPLMQSLTSTGLLNSEPIQKAAKNLRQHACSETSCEWKARLRARELYSMMNCVQCNLCRLHGKVMAIGLGAALQVILGNDEIDGRDIPLDRVQVGALVATAAKFGAAGAVVEKFRELDGEDTSTPSDVAGTASTSTG